MRTTPYMSKLPNKLAIKAITTLTKFNPYYLNTVNINFNSSLLRISLCFSEVELMKVTTLT